MRHLLLLLPLLALCGAKRKAPVTWWEARPPSTLHPLYAASTLDLRAQAPIYDPLVEKVGGRWTSALATEAPVVDGGKVTLRLRKDVKWHDGERFTADDVCATVAALRNRDAPTPLGVRLGPGLRHCAALPSDPSTVVIHLAESGVGDPLSALAFPVLPEHLGPLTDRGHPLATKPVGTGPWRARPGQGVVIYEPATAPHHEGERPVLRLFTVPDDPAEREAALANHRVQGWPVLPADQVPAIRALPGWSLAPYALGEVLTLTLDPSEPPLSDLALRQALHAATDRKALCTALVGTWPDARPAPCRPTMSPFGLDHPATNHGIGLPEPTPLPAEPAHELTVAIQAELGLSAEALGAQLATLWAPHAVTVELLPLADLLAIPATERRERFDAVVHSRLPATADLRPELSLTGGANWFATADAELAEALAGHEREELHALHATLADRHILLPLVELSAMSAWDAGITPLWMTPTDGLGQIERWGLRP